MLMSYHLREGQQRNYTATLALNYAQDEKRRHKEVPSFWVIH